VTELEDRLREGMLPIPDVRTDEDEAFAYFMAERRSAPELTERIRDGLRALMQRLRAQGLPSDELWRYKSRFIGPMAGHEGIALVRDGDVIAYEAIRHY
jgi:hypothetical protein